MNYFGLFTIDFHIMLLSRRELVVKIVKEIPGISYNELGRLTELSNGVISHYILQLMQIGEIVKFGDGRPKYFHYQVSNKDRKIIAVLRNETNREIVKFLLKSQSSISAEIISKEIKKSKSTVSISLKILQKNRIVEKIILNKKTKITSDIGYQIIGKNHLKNFFVKYNI